MRISITLKPAEAEALLRAEALIGARNLWLSRSNSGMAKLALLTFIRSILRGGDGVKVPFPLAFEMRPETEAEREDHELGRSSNIISLT